MVAEISSEPTRSMTRPAILHLGFCLAGLLLVTACHDASRKNSFDPALTPEVELEVALGDTAGTAALTWNPYAGEMPFAEYQVLRNILHSTVVDTLARLADPFRNSYVDTTLQPDTAYEYRIAAVNTGGFAAESLRKRIDGYATRAVRLLSPIPDSETGILHLTWTRYRDPEFEGYQVRRRQVGTDADSLLVALTDLADTTFADRTARHEVDYIYQIVTVAAGRELPGNPAESRLVLPAVQDLLVDVDSRTATAKLQWLPYPGPRFQAYQLWRDDGVQITRIRELTDSAATTFVDSQLIGNIRYAYQIVVRTTRGETIQGPTVDGALHPLVATWPLDIEERAFQTDFVRLYAEPGRHIVALQSRSDAVRIVVFDADGQLLTDRKLLDVPRHWTQKTIATAVGPNGKRLLSLGASAFGMLSYDLEGRLIFKEIEPFADASLPPLDESMRIVLGEIGLASPPLEYATFRAVEVSARGETLFTEDFSGFPNNAWENTRLQGWDFSGPFEGISRGWLLTWGPSPSLARKRDLSWRDFRLEADLIPSGENGVAGIYIGGDTFSRFRLNLDTRGRQVSLDWEFTPPGNLEMEPADAQYSAPFPVHDAAPHHLSMEMADGQLKVLVASPVFWRSELYGYEAGDFLWGSVTSLGDWLAITAEDQAYAVDADGKGDPGRPLPGWASETRSWQVEGERQFRVGICLPELNQIRWGTVLQPLRWEAALRNTIDQRLAADLKGLFYPLSMDAGPDGRMYVLDAGNHRILVFDADGNYITRWGKFGSEPGTFDFGDGLKILRGLNFSGSVCVDEEGYIYVADVFNHRIQKFAP